MLMPSAVINSVITKGIKLASHWVEIKRTSLRTRSATTFHLSNSWHVLPYIAKTWRVFSKKKKAFRIFASSFVISFLVVPEYTCLEFPCRKVVLKLSGKTDFNLFSDDVALRRYITSVCSLAWRALRLKRCQCANLNYWKNFELAFVPALGVQLL